MEACMSMGRREAMCAYGLCRGDADAGVGRCVEQGGGIRCVLGFLEWLVEVMELVELVEVAEWVEWADGAG